MSARVELVSRSPHSPEFDMLRITDSGNARYTQTMMRMDYERKQREKFWQRIHPYSILNRAAGLGGDTSGTQIIWNMVWLGALVGALVKVSGKVTWPWFLATQFALLLYNPGRQENVAPMLGAMDVFKMAGMWVGWAVVSWFYFTK